MFQNCRLPGFTIVVAALGAVVAAPGIAQTYPVKAVRIIIQGPPGGQPDLTARLVGEPLSQELGQPLVFENRPGALYAPAINEALRSPADGYTVLTMDATGWAINPAMGTVSYDFLREFAPVTLLSSTSLMIAAAAPVGINSMQELIAHAKAKPGALSYGTSGIGTPHHLSFVAFLAAAGVEARHIPHKGATEVMASLLRGDIQIGISSPVTALPHARSGKLKALAVTTRNRMRQAPDVPAVAETPGLADFDFAGQAAWLVRVGTPRPIIDRLSAAFRKVATPELVNAVMEKVPSTELVPSTPEQLGELIARDIRKYGEAVKAHKMKPD